MGFSHVDKLNFIELFLHMQIEAYKETTIWHGFAAAGLVLLDPKQVLEKLNIQLKTPTLPPPGSSHSALQSSYLQIPSNLHEMKHCSTSIK